ncbi:(2Fe-2S)-binding protein [Aestuariirhabdus litorea]|uniref:(2Fe-2S)-binding protein n=1 Tax=Aestuariirhabdus litorea TaxID=2528527 RepID=A0A3P3VQQ5_9GAMM|nr:(2Fe-2S)-binding protein [Aestuariirhabdus litorea]RRJ83986.1 (2Fe-2S)-binding protein [Aestuariirhabdus litorea]RWW97206.1 (2Fe-2S)-binding protein [Endozoicomonadaceae bacterium GTF-13]
MFQPLSPDADSASLEIWIDQQPVRVPCGYSVAAALLLAGHRHQRDSLLSGRPRGTYCMMGVCYECLVEIDGIENRQACMTEVEAGMVIRRQRAAGQQDGPTPEALDHGH